MAETRLQVIMARLEKHIITIFRGLSCRLCEMNKLKHLFATFWIFGCISVLLSALNSEYGSRLSIPNRPIYFTSLSWQVFFTREEQSSKTDRHMPDSTLVANDTVIVYGRKFLQRHVDMFRAVNTQLTLLVASDTIAQFISVRKMPEAKLAGSQSET